MQASEESGGPQKKLHFQLRRCWATQTVQCQQQACRGLASWAAQLQSERGRRQADQPLGAASAGSRGLGGQLGKQTA